MTSRRVHFVNVRFSTRELHQLTRAARDSGVPRATYLRQTALGSVPRPRPSRVEREAIYHLAKVGANLNQLAHHANATGKLSRGAELEAVLSELRDVIADLRRR